MIPGNGSCFKNGDLLYFSGPYTIVSGPRRGSTPIASVRQASTQAPNVIGSAQKTSKYLICNVNILWSMWLNRRLCFRQHRHSDRRRARWGSRHSQKRPVQILIRSEKRTACHHRSCTGDSTTGPWNFGFHLVTETCRRFIVSTLGSRICAGTIGAHPRPGTPHCLHAGCSPTHGSETASRCGWLHFTPTRSNKLLNYRSVTIRRWAAVPADQRPPPQPGWKNHRDAAGDRQLWAAAHAGDPRVPALKGFIIHLQYWQNITFVAGKPDDIPLDLGHRNDGILAHCLLMMKSGFGFSPPGGRGHCSAPGSQGERMF